MRRSARIKTAETDAKHIKGPQRVEKGDKNESGNKGYTHKGRTEGGQKATLERAETEAMQIKRHQ